MEYTVRLESVKLENIKNVLNGKIKIHDDKKTRNCDIVGIYGQNGSGKTAVIDCMEIIQELFMGRSLNDRRFLDCLNVNSPYSKISAGFFVTSEGVGHYVVYEVEFRLVGGCKPIDFFIAKESLRCAGGGVRTVFSCDFENDDELFSPKRLFGELPSVKKKMKTRLAAQKLLAKEQKKSLIFSQTAAELLKERALYEKEESEKALNAKSLNEKAAYKNASAEKSLSGKFLNSQETNEKILNTRDLNGKERDGKTLNTKTACKKNAASTETPLEKSAANAVGGTLSAIISILGQYANMDLFVIKNSHSGIISLNELIPFSFKIVEGGARIVKGEAGIRLDQPTLFPMVGYKDVSVLIGQLNVVIKSLVPDLKIELKEYGEQVGDDGEPCMKFEVLARRKGELLPLRNESEGIKKIISILSALISFYNRENTIVLIDELDAGIFEYLLGELLSVLQENARGQLIFTSHNLRPIEILDPESIYFTSCNPNNRYIRPENVGKNVNLRDFYYRAIELGGQKERLYDETDLSELSLALRTAGGNIKL
ncbi:MAG: AAA family ATPase [Clostridiales bacterium]|jgi:AAA15 family ATPase/GTPase|nr:AAA family ATPase [Clostridiales bacterium]